MLSSSFRRRSLELTMRKYRLKFSMLMASRRIVGAFTLGVMTILLGYIIYNQTDPHLMKVVHQNHTCEMNGNNAKWVNFSSNMFRLYVYSAFYDDRPSLLSDPVIRIMAVSDPFESLSVTQLYCILHYGSNTLALLMIDEPKSIGTEWLLNKRNAKAYVYTCPSVKYIIPNAVAISTTLDVIYSACIAITLPYKPEKQREFCICPAPAYGLTLHPYQLIEWMELQRILGVSLVGVYALSASVSVQDVFRHYAAEGFVELREMSYIYSSVYDTDEEYYLQLTPAINDCIYRHMYEFRRIAVIDFDEIIIPRHQKNLSDMVAYLDQKDANEKTRIANYCFRNNDFVLDLPSDNTASPYLSLLRFRRKVVSSEGISVKSIIDPQSCTNMHSNRCWGLTANYSKYGSTLYVDPEIALNQHYKKCNFSNETCYMMLMRNSTRGDVMLRLKETLTKNVRDKIEAITGKGA